MTTTAEVHTTVVGRTQPKCDGSVGIGSGQFVSEKVLERFEELLEMSRNQSNSCGAGAENAG